MLSFALRWLWSFIAPWAGRLVTIVAPGLVSFWPGFSLVKVARGFALLVLAGGVAWLTWWIMRPDPSRGPLVAVSVVEAQRFKAENESLKKSLAKASETISNRDQQAALADQYIEALKSEKEALRAQSSDPDAPVFAADDPWLLGRR